MTSIGKSSSAYQTVKPYGCITDGPMNRWAIKEEIVFIRAVRSVPLVMRERLPGQYLSALDTRV